MGSGGARANPGPAPDPNAARRNRPGDQATWTTLPAEGRAGQAPPFPLLDETVREHDLWRDLWRLPQAVMWERLGQELEVALFVRKLAEAEQPRASVELQKVVRQYLGSLGLSVEGMLRHRWRIEGAEPLIKPSTTSTPKRRTSRSRLKVVRPDEDAQS